MKTYYDYLEESTNVVKSNANRNKIITILSYLLIWAFAMIVFWFFTSGSDAMGYSLMFLWIVLPVTTFIVSVVIGKNDFWGKGKWAFTIFFGAMYMLAEYGTFKMANNIAFNKLNAPDFGMIVAGAIPASRSMKWRRWPVCCCRRSKSFTPAKKDSANLLSGRWSRPGAKRPSDGL